MEWKRTLINCNFDILTKKNSADDIELNLEGKTTFRSEKKTVKALGVIIDNRLTSSDHISACCLEAIRQLNDLTRMSKYLDPIFKSIIYESFITSTVH